MCCGARRPGLKPDPGQGKDEHVKDEHVKDAAQDAAGA